MAEIPQNDHYKLCQLDVSLSVPQFFRQKNTIPTIERPAPDVLRRSALEVLARSL